MTSFKEICKLCLKVANNENFSDFELIDDTIKSILDIFPTELSDQTLVCSKCRIKLHAASEFKSKCLLTAAAIGPSLDLKKPALLDMKDINLYENENKLIMHLYMDQNICRLCMQLTENNVKLQEIDMDALQKFFPEIVNTNAIKDPLVCNSCFDSFETHSRFLKSCLEVEGNKKPGFPKQEDEESKPLFGHTVKMENVDVQLEDEAIFNYNNKLVDFKTEYEENDQIAVKTEAIYIKSEEDSNDSLTEFEGPIELSSESGEYGKWEGDGSNKHENLQVKTYECSRCDLKTEYMNFFTEHLRWHNQMSKSGMADCKYKINMNNDRSRNSSISNNTFNNIASSADEDPSHVEAGLHKCKICSYTTDSKECFELHQTRYNGECDMCNCELKLKKSLRKWKHKDKSGKWAFFCDTCDFKTVHKNVILRHLLIHKADTCDRHLSMQRISTELQVYKCRPCKYKTNSLQSIREHRSTHKYKCDKCSFKSAYEKSLISHQEKHSEPVKAIYKCDQCNYEGKSGYKLKKHKKIHIKHSEMQTYNCYECEYVTTNRSCFLNHLLKHKDLSQVTTFKCDYKTIFSNNLRKHSLVHKNLSETEMHKCTICDFKTKRKCYLQRHQIKHKSSLEVRMYKCDTCDFETKYSSTLKKHCIKHEKLSEVKMYKCDMCTYATKYSSNLAPHRLTHKSPSEVQIFKCNDCNYKTRHMNKLQSHATKHKNPPAVQRFKCDECDYETEMKNALQEHRLEHKNIV